MRRAASSALRRAAGTVGRQQTSTETRSFSKAPQDVTHGAKKAAERERAARERAGLPLSTPATPPPKPAATPQVEPPAAPAPAPAAPAAPAAATPQALPQAPKPPPAPPRSGLRGVGLAGGAVLAVGAAGALYLYQQQRQEASPATVPTWQAAKREPAAHEAPPAEPEAAPQPSTAAEEAPAAELPAAEVDVTPPPAHVEPPAPTPAVQEEPAPPPPAQTIPAEAAAAAAPEPPAVAPAPEPGPPPARAPPSLVALPDLPPEALPALPGPEGLVQATLAQAARAGEEWATVYRAMLTQSAVDVAVFAAEAAQRDQAFAAEEAALRRAALAAVEAADAAAGEAKARAKEAETALRAKRAELAAAREAAAAKLAADAQARVRAATDQAAAAAAKHILEEREAAAAAARGVADALDAACAAAEQRTVAARLAADARALAAAALAWERRLARGGRFDDVASRVAAHAADEPMLAAAAQSVAATAPRGVATREALAAQLPPLADAVRRLALLPADTPPSAPRYALSVLAALLRLREPAGDAGRARARVPCSGGGVEGALARAQHAAAHGEFVRAAEELERTAAGSAAAVAAAPWVAAARDRAAAEQALQLLRAHCTRLAAALASGPDSKPGK